MSLSLELLDGFDGLAPEAWADLLARSETRCVFLTREWMEAWWRALGEGRLLLIVATRNGRPLALAPFHAHAGTVRFLGTDSSDYLDLLGDVSDPSVPETLLAGAIDASGASRFCLAMIPERSPTGERLRTAARRLNLALAADEPVPAPQLERAGLLEAARKRSLMRHARWFERQGTVEVSHASAAEAILPHLDDFFRQHVERCALAPYPSLFNDPRQRDFYRALTLSDVGWLRFTRVAWRGLAVAYHFGMLFDGAFIWYKPSFEPTLAQRSPGEMLLRHLLLAAFDEGAHTFDFGIGDEAFKYRFATSVPQVRTWLLG